VRGPAGENLDRFLGGDGDPTPLEPGEERAVFKASNGFGTVPGSYAEAVGGRLALRLTVGDQAARWPEEGRGTSGGVDSARHPNRRWATLPLRGAWARGRGVKAVPGGVPGGSGLGVGGGRPGRGGQGSEPDGGGWAGRGDGAARVGRPMMRRLVASAAAVGRASRAATIRRLWAGTT
jgi:hypothetical protein